MSDVVAVSQPGVFVDTNALHYIRAYLEVSKRYDLVPYGTQNSWEDVNAVLREQRLLPSQRKHLNQGFKALAFLQQRAQEDYQIFVSRICLAEIVHGMLEGRAHLRMAQQGMPYRMRQRTSDLSALVRSWLNAGDYARIRQDVDALLPSLEAVLNTEVVLIEQDRSSREVLSLLEVVLEHVYFDVIDGWLYAESLTEQAELLLTFDGYFRQTINLICKPGDAQDDEEREMWKQVRQSLQKAVASVLLVSLAEARDLIVPQAPTRGEIKGLVPLKVDL